MIQIMYLLSLTISFIFMQMHHPLAMGLILLIQTIFVSLMIGLMNKTFWFSYILYLIFLGGMLVVFIYVTSLASNEMFSFSTKLLIYSTLFLLFNFIMTYMFMDQMMFNENIFNEEMTCNTNTNMFSMENSLNLYKLYNYPTNLITILLMNYLLITLIAIVKITKLFYWPIRMMN